jgi:flagellar hook-associated protein 2
MTTVSSTTSTASTTTSSSSSTNSTSTTGTNTTSSVDWNALITSEVNAKLARATTIQTSITSNQAKITAYQSLQTSLGTLATAASSLSNSIQNSLSSSVFATRSATISSTGDVSASSSLSMSVASGAATGDHTLQIEQVATAQKVIGSSVADQTASLGYTGTFSIGLAGGTSADISITSGMTVQDVADAINNQTSTTNVQASVIEVSSNSYELVLSGTKDAADIQTSSVSGDDVLNKLGVTDSSGSFTDVLQASQPAKLKLDGVELTRDTNDISDVLSGVTFSLLQATTSGTTINISIGTDTSQIQTALQTFVTDYNAVRDFVNTQQQTNSDGTASSSSVLFGDGTMRDIMTRAEQALNTTVGSMSLSDLGLSFNTTNELVLDTSQLSTTLTNNLSGAISLLSAQTTTSSSDLSVVNTASSSPASFKLDLAVDSSGKLTSASVGGDSSLFTVSGQSIVGNSGTAYAGMAFTYSGSTSKSVTVTSTSGIAAQIYNIANTDSSTTSGSLQDLIENLTTQDDTMQQQIDDIDANATEYQTALKNEYAKYESAISTANSTLNYLSALLNKSSS